jgi:hypothetical protein
MKKLMIIAAAMLFAVPAEGGILFRHRAVAVSKSKVVAGGPAFGAARCRVVAGVRVCN